MCFKYGLVFVLTSLAQEAALLAAAQRAEGGLRRARVRCAFVRLLLVRQLTCLAAVVHEYTEATLPDRRPVAFLCAQRKQAS